MNITFDMIPQCLSEIIERLGKIEQRLEELMEEKNKNDEFFSEYIPKNEVRGKLASSTTLWNLERQGKLTSYGIGGKRYYKRSEIKNLIQPVKQNKR